MTIMRRKRRQEGYALILMLGIIAAVGIMSAGMVTLLGNVQSNGSADRMRVKAFNVAEAALDNSLYALQINWPSTSTSSLSIDTSTFRSLYSTSEFPDPSSGPFVSVEAYDNLSPIDKTVQWDSNGDNTMYVEVQANVGSAQARIQAEAEMQYFNAGVPHGVALYAGQNLYSNGGGNNPKITDEVSPPVGTPCTIDVGGTIDDPSVADTAHGIQENVGANSPSISQVFPQSLVDQIKQLAVSVGRYFSGPNAVQDALNSPANPYYSPQGGESGLCVIENPGSTVSIGQYPNSVTQPGLFLVLGADIDMSGTNDFYGVLYTDQNCEKAHGTPTVHGMLVCGVNGDYRGTANLMYNDNVITNISKTFPLSVQMVPNTWREIPPQ